jgi:hypothetical protein
VCRSYNYFVRVSALKKADKAAFFLQFNFP